MKLFYDLHIHSALSPCGDNDMTPNNVINMAKISGLDVVALTDHNSTDNLVSFKKVADKSNIIFIPGIELNTSEEVHLLAYFQTVESACLFGDFIYNSLPDIKNNNEFFGDQLVMDDNDYVIGEKDKLLISALPYTFEECLSLIHQYNGIPVPAHINKGANSLINNLGFIPENQLIKTIEYRPEYPCEKKNNYFYVVSSDAHYLENIADREHSIQVDYPKVADVLNFLSGYSL